MRHFLIGGMVAGVLLAPAVAADERRAHGVHEHGAATLNAALDGGELYLELSSPAMNLVGFEYVPSSDEDLATVARAVATLEDGARLFGPSAGAECALAAAEVELPEDWRGRGLPDPKAKHHQEAHDHGDAHHDHAEGHGHDHGHDHDHGHAHAHDTHADIHASWRFTCAEPGGLSALDIGLFAAFPGLERLRIQSVGPAGQSAAELTAADPVLRF